MLFYSYRVLSFKLSLVLCLFKSAKMHPIPSELPNSLSGLLVLSGQVSLSRVFSVVEKENKVTVNISYIAVMAMRYYSR